MPPVYRKSLSQSRTPARNVETLFKRHRSQPAEYFGGQAGIGALLEPAQSLGDSPAVESSLEDHQFSTDTVLFPLSFTSTYFV